MKIRLLIFCALPLTNSIALAENSLSLTPAKCVTLKQGNTCYQDLKVSWQADQLGYYCLFNSQNVEPEKCWKQANKGRVSFEFSGEKSVDYQLLKMPEKLPILQKHFSVKWVYKARPNNRWRLF